MTVAQFGVMTLVICLTGAPIEAQAPLTIYVSAQEQEDGDPALQESLREVRREFGRTRGVRVVDRPENASVSMRVLTHHIRVVEESITVPGQTVGGRTASGISGTSRTLPETVTIQAERHLIEVAVRFDAGDYTLSAEDKTSRATAREIAKKVVALVQANRGANERNDKGHS